jgi:hypothetical protein
MLVLQHLGSAAILAITFMAIGLITDRLKLTHFEAKDYFILLLGLMAAQAIDFDHYRGSIKVLLKCGMITDCKDPYLSVCNEQLSRGFMHSPTVFFVLAPLTVIVSIYSTLTRHKKVALLLLGLLTGWITHLYLDQLPLF